MLRRLAAVLMLNGLILAYLPASYGQSASETRALRTGAAQDVIQLAANGTASQGTGEGDEDEAARVNAWTVGVVGGQLEGTFVRFAAELAKALDDGDNLRVLPIISYGAIENMNDLLYLHGVDIAITNSDALEEFRKRRNIEDIDQHINYISQMYVSEVHVYARTDINSLNDLDGKSVSLGRKGAGQSVTGPIIFERLGVKPKFIYGNTEAHLEGMKSGEVAAIVLNGGKPNSLFSRLKANPKLHFLPVPYTEKFQDYYAPSSFTSKDYPNLLKDGETIETLGIPAVLAVYNWPETADRHRKVKRFIQYYFERFERFQKPPFHPKWREINLAADVPGWTRYSVATEMLAEISARAPMTTDQKNQPQKSVKTSTGPQE